MSYITCMQVPANITDIVMVLIPEHYRLATDTSLPNRLWLIQYY